MILPTDHVERGSAPLIEMADIWARARDRMLAQARVLVTGSDLDQASRIAEVLQDAGHAADAAGDLERARELLLAGDPEVRLVTCLGPGDARIEILGGEARSAGAVALAIVPSEPAADSALAAGADDVLLPPLNAQRVLARVRARLRQAVSVRLLERLAGELRGVAASAGAGGGESSDLLAHLDTRRALYEAQLQARAPRLLVSWAEAARVVDLLQQIQPLGAQTLSAPSATDVSEMLSVAGADVALVHAWVPGGADAALAAARRSHPHTQVAVLETSGSEAEADGCLLAGAVTSIPVDVVSPTVLCAIVRRLLVFRGRLSVLERGMLDIAREAPRALAVWRAARMAEAGPGNAPVAALDAVETLRRDPRLSLDVAVSVVPKENPGIGLDGTTLDLSLGGAFIACPFQIGKGSQVACELRLDTGVVKLDAVVVRTGAETDSGGRPVPGFAVQFENPSRAAMAALAAYMRRQIAK